MNGNAALDVRRLIDDRPLTGFQRLLVFVGFLVVLCDGFDAVILGFIVPQLRVDWSVSHHALGIVLSAGLIGQAAGAMIAGPLADHYGRKWVIVLSVAWFGAWTLATAASGGIDSMLAFRFLTGLGLGAAMPNASTLVAEYAPTRSRSLLVTLTLCGFAAGAALGGFISAWMIPRMGWRGVLVLGGLAPLIGAGFLIAWLPESIGYLATRHAFRDRVASVVERLAPGLATGGATFSYGRDEPESAGAIGMILSPRYRFGTAMLWTGYFSVLFMAYLLSSWLPSLIKEGAGYSVADAAVAAAVFQVGGPIGSVCIGWAMDRWSKGRTLGCVFLCGVAGMLALGHLDLSYALLCFVIGLLGFCVNGGSVGMNALAASFYPTAFRATGTCWMVGVGRIGATLSAVTGGELLGAGWTASQVFTLLAAPALLAALSMFVQNAGVGVGIIPVQWIFALSRGLYRKRKQGAALSSASDAALTRQQPQPERRAQPER